jgi:ferric-dicitrate binding protein FerR (iron transport regulator)
VKLTDQEAEQLREWFTYHTPTPEQVEAYQRIRGVAQDLAATIMETCPASADRTAALRKVREAVMTANASIACGGK